MAESKVRRFRLYLETSVWGALLPGQPAEMRRVSRQLLGQLGLGQAFISSIVLDEVECAQESIRLRLVEEIRRVAPTILGSDAICEELAQAYIDAGILKAKKRNDALHVATTIESRGELELSASGQRREAQAVRGGES